jgi:hypothetical protein
LLRSLLPIQWILRDVAGISHRARANITVLTFRDVAIDRILAAFSWHIASRKFVRAIRDD